MNIFSGVIGLLVFIGILYLWSENKKEVKWKYVGTLLVIMLGIAFVFTRTTFGIAVGKGIANFFDFLTKAAQEGIGFVFGGLGNVGEGGVFFLNVLMPILFISVLVGILLKLGVMQFITKWLGKGISKISGTDDLLAYESVNSFVLSQTGIFVSAKEFIDNLTERQIWSMALMGNATISSTIIGAYLQMLTPQYVITATLLNVIVGLLAVNIVFPESKNKENELNNFDMEVAMKKPEGNVFQVISEYASTGFSVVVAIAVSLMAFVGLIGLLNNTFDLFTGMTFTKIMGMVFAPVAWLMGAGSDWINVGQLLATKLLSNEFVAIGSMGGMNLSTHATAIASVAMLSFANLSCIGILYGGIAGVSKKQASVFMKKGFKIILVSFICSLITGTVTGLMVF